MNEQGGLNWMFWRRISTILITGVCRRPCQQGTSTDCDETRRNDRFSNGLTSSCFHL